MKHKCGEYRSNATDSLSDQHYQGFRQMVVVSNV